MMYYLLVGIFICLMCGELQGSFRKKYEDKEKCPKVKAIRNFLLEELLGKWYVIEYYASSEEALSYRCMRADFTTTSLQDVTMNFTYSFTDDPINEILVGNITWTIPSLGRPAHWVHSEDTYEGVYNTYVLDSDYKSWALLLHCAEKKKVPRYLSSFIMSRKPTLGINEKAYLRDKLPRYDIDVSYLFDMSQDNCNVPSVDNIPPPLLMNRKEPSTRRHPMKHIHG
ncbi:hypothetical protein WA026_019731 [Henosepilachna vigintioctopunctata]|uniref:Apolipoprotein D n=1 Tax=Henosepilachna vigintioctopunctata TaxID=420089 RepID=A0AAW1UNW5_9CUCU